jgi:methyl-accepting chemotaxis protein
MDEYIQKIEGWMDQVKDEETDVENYDFLEEAVTEGNTLGNIGSYLAIYETEDGLYVDDDLLEALDQKKTEIAKEESSSPAHIRERTNHREAVYGDLTGEEKLKVRNNEKTLQELRDDGEIEQGLLDGSFNGTNSGHAFVQNMINEFKKSSNYEEPTSQDGDYPKKPSTSQSDTTEKPNQEIILPSGGEKIMTDYEELNNELDAVYDSLESLESGVESIPQEDLTSELETLTDEISDVRTYVSRIEGALEIAKSDAQEMEDTIQRDDEILDITASTLGSIADKVSDYGDQLEEYVDSQDEVTESLNGALHTLQEIGGGASYNGPSDEVRQIMDDRLDDEGFEEFQKAASRFE